MLDAFEKSPTRPAHQQISELQAQKERFGKVLCDLRAALR
jgi:hypothetical protein